MRLPGKIAVIAGSGSRMSRAVALLFAQEGARIYLLARTSQASEETVALVTERGGVARYIQADLTSDEQTRATFDRIVTETGGVDIVCHFIGEFMSWEHDITRLEPDFWEGAYAAIMRTLFLTTRYAVQAMEARRGGAILTIGASYRVRLAANEAYASARAPTSPSPRGYRRLWGSATRWISLPPAWTCRRRCREATESSWASSRPCPEAWDSSSSG